MFLSDVNSSIMALFACFLYPTEELSWSCPLHFRRTRDAEDLYGYRVYKNCLCL